MTRRIPSTSAANLARLDAQGRPHDFTRRLDGRPWCSTCGLEEADQVHVLPHEPHGHCSRCHTGVHRYHLANGGLTTWQHVAGGGHTGHQLHLLDVVVDCCEDHKRAHLVARGSELARIAREGRAADREGVMEP